MVVSLMIDFLGACLASRLSRTFGVSAISVLVIGVMAMLAATVLFDFLGRRI